MRWRRSLRLAPVLGLAVFAASCSGSDVTSISAVPTPSTDPAPGVTTPATTDPVTTDPPTTDPPTTDPLTSVTTPPTSEPVTTEPVDVDRFDPGIIEWERYDADLDTATLEVPVDWSDPDGPTFELYLVRHNSTDPDRRIGSLLVNPGGPGSPGSFLAYSAPYIYDEALLRHFDIVAWDPRGTGDSVPPIDCIDDYDPYFTDIDSTPDDEAERLKLVEISRRFAEQCIEKNEYLDHVGTNNSARDMDAIRRALGEETISYFGFSYGSELGATWATLFPDTVRAAVLDGAADPNADGLESSIQQLRGFEASLTSFLADCSARSACVFHNAGDAEGAFDRLMEALDSAPIPSGDPTRPPVNRDVATTAVIVAMYSDTSWGELARALADAQDGDGEGLMALHDSYYQRQPDGTYDNFLEAFPVISCADTAERETVAETDAEIPLLTEVAPRLVPEGSRGGYTCTFFPPAVDPRIEITGAGSVPILVIGTTGDPSTPLDSTIAMANTLESSRLLVVEADQHTGYGVNTCVDDTVSDYLVGLTLPDDGARC